MKRGRYSIGVFSALFGAGLVLLVQAEPFFWDTIQLGSRHANWFYQQAFSQWLLPDDMDSGHIPAFGWYLAKCWQWFGRSLVVSHWAMLPWILLVLWQIYRLVDHLQPAWLWPGVLLLLADPTLLAQLSLISPDIILVAGFLLAVNSILRHERINLAVAIALLGLTSLRGMMLGIALFVWHMYRQFPLTRSGRWKILFSTLLPYLPGGCLALTYLGYHYAVKGWIGVHDDSPWAASFAATGIGGMIKQIIIVAWRLLDFGRIFLLLGLVLAWQASNWYWSGRLRQLLALTIIVGLILGLPAVLSPGLAQHRYLLPVYLCFGMLFLELLPQIKPIRWRNTIYSLVMAGLVSGNFWIYPDSIAQGWDASLAHKTYFNGRSQAINYAQKEQIALADIGTAFPEIGSVDDRELNGEITGFSPWQAQSFNYILYSNVMNDFSDEFRNTLATGYRPIFSYRKRGVTVILYEKSQ
ncbi:MAG: hypothetical protein AAFZ63_02985 [Bacteroidota bacterium]